MPFFYLDYWYIVLVVPAIIVSMIASGRVRTTFNKYNKIKVSSVANSNYVVERILRNNEIYDVSIDTVKGDLTDHYNPANKTLNLSQSTAGNNSIGAIGVAAHEAGHAIQFKNEYFPAKLRTTMVPVVNIGSSIGFSLIIIGLFLASSDILLQIGIVLYSLAFIFTLVTLPVEFDASRRAVASIEQMGFMSDEELRGVKKVLNAAAFTYIASMLVALASLLRIILLASGNRGRRR